MYMYMYVSMYVYFIILLYYIRYYCVYVRLEYVIAIHHGVLLWDM